MNNQWIVLEDKKKHGKRFVSIEDTVNKRKYSNYFPLIATDSDVIVRFQAHVKEYREEISKKGDKLDLTNFEDGL